MTNAGEVTTTFEDVNERLQDQNLEQIATDLSAHPTGWQTVAGVMALRPENGVLPKLNAAHVDIPIPPPRSASSTRVWHYGWPIGIDFVDETIQHFIPDYNTNTAFALKLPLTTIMVKKYLGLRFEVNFAYVEPDDAEWLPEPFYPGAPGLGFIAFVSTHPPSRLRKRLTQAQLDKMVRSVAGEPPHWMEGAREKDGIYEKRSTPPE